MAVTRRCENTPFFKSHFHSKTRSFDQDRLGTNIGKVEGARRFSQCKTLNHTVTKLASTARGYSAYVKAK